MPAGHRRVSTIQQRVGRRVRQLREDQGVTQAELARRMKTSPSHLNAIEMGRRAIVLPTVESIARSLRVEIADLFPPGKDGPIRRRPTKAERAVFRIAERLRSRDPDYLRCVEKMLRVLDEAFEVD